MIYLDNAATSWPKPEEVYKAVDNCLRHLAGSPGRGGYKTAREADRLLFETREELAELLGAGNSANIIFTSNATEALNTALFGLLQPGDRIITSSMEHNAVARPLRVLESRGVILEVLGCDKIGRLNMEELKQALRKKTKAVIINHGSNVTGILQPIREIGQLAAAAGAEFIVDGAQTAGIQEIDVEAMKISIMGFSGHKGLLGPQGTGGLYVRDKLILNPLRYGGTGSQSESDLQPLYYPDRLESGTPNTPGLAGLLAGLRFIKKAGRKAIEAKEKQLTRQLRAGLSQIPSINICSCDTEQEHSAIVSFCLDGLDSGEVTFMLDRDFGIAARAGLHCAPWAHKTIGTLISGAIRLSPGYFNTSEEIEAAINALEVIAYKGGKHERNNS